MITLKSVEMSAQDSAPRSPRIKRRRGACQLCREKKARCNGEDPCSFCKRHDSTCTYLPTKARTHGNRASVHHQHGAIASSTMLSGTPTEVVTAPWYDTMDWSYGSADQSHEPWTDDSHSIALHDETDVLIQELGSSLGDGQSGQSAVFSPSLPDFLTSEVSWAATGDSDPMKLLQNATDLVKGTEWTFATSSSGQSLDNTLSTSPRPPKDSDQEIQTEEPTAITSPDKHGRRRSLLFPNLHSSAKLSMVKSAHVSCNHHAAEIEAERSDKQTSIKLRVDQITSKLLSRGFILGLPRAWADHIRDDFHSDTNSIRSLSADQMHDLVNLCFEDPIGISCLIEKVEVTKLFREDRFSESQNASTSSDRDKFLLILCLAWGAMIDPGKNPDVICDFQVQLLEQYQVLIMKPDSISKYICIVAMTIFAFKFGLEKCSSILAEAISLAQSLRLHLDISLQEKESGLNTVQVKRATWLLFIVDKRYALRWRTFPLLPDPGYEVPSLEQKRFVSRTFDYDSRIDEWRHHLLLHQCRYAQLCARITRLFFSSTTSTTSLTKRATENNEVREVHELFSNNGDSANINGLLAELHDWFTSIPSNWQRRGGAEGDNGPQAEYRAHLKISVAYQYYEAVLSVLSFLGTGRSSTCCRDPLKQTDQTATGLLIPTIKSVLETGTQISQITFDRTLLHVPTMALCLLAVEKGNANPELITRKREGQVLIAMAYGLFGRLSEILPHHKFFELVAELVAVIDRF